MAKNGNGNGSGIRVEVLKDKQARQALPELCAEYRRLAEEGNAINAALKAVKQDIDEMAKKARAKKVVGDGWMLLRVSTTRKTIRQELLLEHGVAMDVIEASTEVSKGTHYQVRKAAND